MARARNPGFDSQQAPDFHLVINQTCLYFQLELTLCKHAEAQSAGRILSGSGKVNCSPIWLKTWPSVWTSKDPSRVNSIA